MHTDARSAKKDVISTKPQKAMGAERTFPDRASEGEAQSHLSCVRVVSIPSLEGKGETKNI